MELRADYELTSKDIKPKYHYIIRMNRWLVMDSPKWVQKLLAKYRPHWFAEYALFFQLEEEVTKMINEEILKELQKVMEDELRE